MRGEVLGPVRLRRDGDVVPLPAGNVGTLLGLLLLQPNQPVATEELSAALWPEPLSESVATRRLQVTVSRLRAALDDGDDTAMAVEAIESGYVLRASSAALDRVEFEALGASALEGADVGAAEAALELWRGRPYGGLLASSQLITQLTRLTELRRRLVDLVRPPAPAEQLRRAKIRAPRHAAALIERAALAKSPKVGEARALAVVAPAGYGKSTFLAQWSAMQAHPVAWLSLDEDDDDPNRFWSGLEEALGSVLGDLLGGDDVRLGSTAMLDDLADGTAPSPQFGLVLDDVHRLHDPRVLREVGRLVQSLPPGCTIALASRRDLPTPLPQLLAEGAAHLVGQDDLAFDDEELGVLVGGDAIRAGQLLHATGGWPLAAAAVHRSGADVAGPLPAAVDRYVAGEVVDVLPVGVRRLLLHVALLDAFTVDLCEVVLDRRDAGESLAWLRDRDLFVIDAGSDVGEGWFRLHPVVSRVARRRGSAEINASRVWRRAARWFRDQGMSEAALEYAVRARDRALIGEVAGDVLLDAALRGEATRCVHLLQRIDPEDLVTHPRGHGVGVYLATEWMDKDDRNPWVLSRKRHFGDDDAVWSLVSAIEAMREGRSTEAVDRSEEVMHRCLEGSLADVGELGSFLLGSAFSNLIRARVLQGTTTHDDDLFPSAVALIRPHAPLLAAWVHSFWGFVAFADGAIDLATTLAEEFFRARVSKELGRHVRRDNSMLGALLAAEATAEVGRLRRIAEGIEDLPVMYEAKGQHTEATISRLIIARIYRAADLPAAAEPHRRRADAMLRTFPDAPFLHRWRTLLSSPPTPTRRAVLSSTDVLTPRQLAIAGYLASDLSAEEIAGELFISYQTLRTHLREIYRRLGVHSRHEAVARLTALRG